MIDPDLRHATQEETGRLAQRFPDALPAVLLTKAARLMLARQRHESTVAELAKVFNVSETTILAWEISGDDRLCRHWRGWGFTGI